MERDGYNQTRRRGCLGLIAYMAIALMAVIMICSCSTQKSVTNTDRDSSLSYADTTKIVADTTGYKQTDTDTTKAVATYEGIGLIEFVADGGKVSIDSAGNVTFEGIKNIKGKRKGNIEQDKGVSRKVEEAAGHREQLKGVNIDQTQREKRTEEKTPARKWYETALARLGLGVCIAALMWLIFLYLKRKF